MSSMKFAKGPLYAALAVGVVGFLVLLLPRIGVSLPFAGDLVGAGLGLFTLVLLTLSVIMGGKAATGDELAFPEEDLMPSVAFGPQGTALYEEPVKLSWKEKMALRAEEKAAKKSDAERLKFEQEAQRDASRAARDASRNRVASDDAAEWLSDIKQGIANDSDETSPFGSVAQPVFQATPPAQPYPAFPQTVAPVMTPIATAAAEMAAQQPTYGRPEDAAGTGSATGAPMFEGAAASDYAEPPEPEWAEAAYQDPMFSIPFVNDRTHSADYPDAVTFQPKSYDEAGGIGDAFRRGSTVIVDLTTVGDEDARRFVDFGAGLVVSANGTMERIDTKVFLLTPQDTPEDTEPEAYRDVVFDLSGDEALTEAQARFDVLSTQMLDIVSDARTEVARVRAESDESRRTNEQRVATLTVALEAARGEVERLNEEVIAANAQHRNVLDAESLLAQAQIDLQKADLERQQVAVRLRQIRFALVREEPVNEDALSAIDKALEEIQAPPAAEMNEASDLPSETAQGA